MVLSTSETVPNESPVTPCISLMESKSKTNTTFYLETSTIPGLRGTQILAISGLMGIVIIMPVVHLLKKVTLTNERSQLGSSNWCQQCILGYTSLLSKSKIISASWTYFLKVIGHQLIQQCYRSNYLRIPTMFFKLMSAVHFMLYRIKVISANLAYFIQVIGHWMLSL